MILKGNYKDPSDIIYRGTSLECVHIGKHLVWEKGDGDTYAYALSGGTGEWQMYQSESIELDVTQFGNDCKEYIEKYKVRALRIRYGNTIRTIPDDGDGAWIWNQDNIPLEITFHSDSKLRTIGSGFFNGCDVRNSVIFPNGLVTIGNYCLSNCKNLKLISFPKTLFDVGVRVGPTSGLTLLVNSLKVLVVTGYMVSEHWTDIKIYVRDELLIEYRFDDPFWKNYATSIYPISQYK